MSTSVCFFRPLNSGFLSLPLFLYALSPSSLLLSLIYFLPHCFSVVGDQPVGLSRRPKNNNIIIINFNYLYDYVDLVQLINIKPMQIYI